MSRNPICIWDFTWFNLHDENQCISIIEKFCKHWCFQEEKCPTTGTLHMQGRISLKEKSRNPWWGAGLDIKFSITSIVNFDNTFYVTKEESRVRGPWTDRDEKIYIPRDVREITSLYPWQESLRQIALTYEKRKVNIVYDPTGNSGKSTFTRIAMVYKWGRKIPFANDYKDIMRMVMDMPESKCYMFDLPRAISKDKLYQFYGAIEEIKGGYAFDDRYHFKERFFDPPAVIVFTNVMPEQRLLSSDRWIVWTIQNSSLILANAKAFCNNNKIKELEQPERLLKLEETNVVEK